MGLRGIGCDEWMCSRSAGVPFGMAATTTGVRAFVLTGGSASGPDMAELLVKHLQRMSNLASARRPPFIARVTKSDVRVEK